MSKVEVGLGDKRDELDRLKHKLEIRRKRIERDNRRLWIATIAVAVILMVLARLV